MSQKVNLLIVLVIIVIIGGFGFYLKQKPAEEPVSTEQKVIKLFWIDNQLMPEGQKSYSEMVKGVTTTLAVSADISNEDLALETISALLERSPGAGYSSSISEDTQCNGLTIKDTRVTVDFNSALSDYGGGSANALTIKAQIGKTLRQFDFIKEIGISIDGQTAGVLQP